ncbi:MAG: phytoene desaturase [Calditrichia bacterium]
MKKRIAIIGSGFGGLAAAIRLQARGFQVTVFEKNEHPGGHAYPLVKNGYKFDMGPSLITAPDIIRKVFAAAGKKMEDYLQLIPLDPFYRIYFHDKTYIDYTGDEERMKEQMRQFNPDDAANYDRFMSASRDLYKAVIQDGMGSRPFDKWGTMLKFMPRAIRLNALLPSYYFVKRYFEDFRHRFMFSFHPLFIGGNPFAAPAVYLMIPYLEKEGGVWFTKGGMTSVVQALVRVFKEIGGDLQTSTPVEKILVQNGQATGVRVKGESIPFDAVISNADFMHTYGKLIDPEHRSKWTDSRLKKVGYSMGAYLLYLGVKKQYPELLHHTLILSPRYKELVQDIFKHKILPEDFSMYLHVPTRTDEGMAPEGCESMYVLIPVANLSSGIDWAAIKEQFTDKVIDFLEKDFGLTDLRQHIEVKEIYTPAEFSADRNSFLGSAWGVEPKFTQTAVFRPHNRSEDIRNLYLVGASTHPGAGIPGVLLTAEVAEKVVTEDFPDNRLDHKVS